MTEQQLRAAVAEYDAEMAEAMDFDPDGLSSDDGNVQWMVGRDIIIRECGGYPQESDVLISHAATMRAMDAAARAFEEAMK